MKRAPVPNDPDNPMVSILVFNYDESHLRPCLDSIFDQDIVENFEVILILDPSYAEGWETALEFVRRYPERITVQRNRRILGPHINLHKALQMAWGRFCVPLTNEEAFRSEYVKGCVEAMASDAHAGFAGVYRVDQTDLPIPQPLPWTAPSVTGKPLVSILCYNYNYGRYLRECLDSVFAQTYENIELCFSDNASTDVSWQIALEFVRRFPDRMYVTRNRANFGADPNVANCLRNMSGKYYILLCSDDVLDPEYVEKCVNVMEANPNVGMVIVNRAIIDENSRRTEEAPFYNQSCVIPGEEQAAVYMMAGVNPSISQVMYRSDIVHRRSATGGVVTRYYGTRILDFNVSLDYDVAFIKDPLLLNREHSRTHSREAERSLMPVLGIYVLNHQLADIGACREIRKVTERLPKAIEKVAQLAIRYSVRNLLAGDEITALRYFHLARAIELEIVKDPQWKQLEEYWEADATTKKAIVEHLRSVDNLVARRVSYDPPAGSIPLPSQGTVLSENRPEGNGTVVDKVMFSGDVLLSKVNRA